jgi:uncharacterized protein YkwD
MNLVTIAFVLLISTYSKESDLPTKNSTTNALPTTVNKSVLLQLVNEVRKKGCQCGDTYYNPVPPVTWNEQLEKAAYNHSVDMYQNKYFSHLAPDGSKGGVRIERVGYKWMAFGENIAMGYKTEREVVEGWIKSPGHCKNIMKKIFKEMGVARYGNFWTQEFGCSTLLKGGHNSREPQGH